MDEIGDMPMPMQAKLLRVLENGEVVRVGSNDPLQVDVRIIAGTNVLVGTTRDSGEKLQVSGTAKLGGLKLTPVRVSSRIGLTVIS